MNSTLPPTSIVNIILIITLMVKTETISNSQLITVALFPSSCKYHELLTIYCYSSNVDQIHFVQCLSGLTPAWQESCQPGSSFYCDWNIITIFFFGHRHHYLRTAPQEAAINMIATFTGLVLLSCIAFLWKCKRL